MQIKNHFKAYVCSDVKVLSFWNVFMRISKDFCDTSSIIKRKYATGYMCSLVVRVFTSRRWCSSSQRNFKKFNFVVFLNESILWDERYMFVSVGYHRSFTREKSCVCLQTILTIKYCQHKDQTPANRRQKSRKNLFVYNYLYLKKHATFHLDSRQSD